MVTEADLQQVPVDEQKVVGAATGRSGLKIYSGHVFEEYQRELRGINAVRVYDEMRRSEPVIAGMLSAITTVLQGVQFEFHAGRSGAKEDSKDAADIAAKELVERAWTMLESEELLENICTMFAFGWALFEPVYVYKEGRIWWERIALRGHDSLYIWEFDDATSQVTAFVQRPAPSFREIRIPAERFLLFRTSSEKGNPEGISLLRAAYKPYYYKRTIEEVEAIGAERDLVGIPVMHVPYSATNDEAEEARKIVERVSVDEQVGIAMTATGPEDADRFKFELLTGQGSSAKIHSLERVIQRYSTEMTMVALAQFLRLGSDGASGSYNLSSDQRDLFQVAMRGWLRKIVSVFNRVAIPRLLAMNGMRGHCHMIPGRVSQLNLQVIANFLTSGVQNGWITADPQLESFIRREAELPPPDPNAKKEPPPGAEANDNSGLNANPGENQKGGMFDATKAGAKVAGADDAKKAKTPAEMASDAKKAKAAMDALKASELYAEEDEEWGEFDLDIELMEILAEEFEEPDEQHSEIYEEWFGYNIEPNPESELGYSVTSPSGKKLGGAVARRVIEASQKTADTGKRGKGSKATKGAKAGGKGGGGKDPALEEQKKAEKLASSKERAAERLEALEERIESAVDRYGDRLDSATMQRIVDEMRAEIEAAADPKEIAKALKKGSKQLADYQREATKPPPAVQKLEMRKQAALDALPSVKQLAGTDAALEDGLRGIDAEYRQRMRNATSDTELAALQRDMRRAVSEFKIDAARANAAERKRQRPQSAREWAEYYSEQMLLFHGNHDQKTHAGKGGGMHGDGERPEPSAAFTAMKQGKAVEIAPDHVDEMMDFAAKHPETINLLKMRVDGAGNENFGEPLTDLPRSKMPQLPEDSAGLQRYSQYLAKNGVRARVEEVDPRSLRATQAEIDSRKVGAIYQSLEKTGGKLGDTGGTLIVSKEGAVVDGHHRFYSTSLYAVQRPVKVKILRTDADINTMLKLSDQFGEMEGIAKVGLEAPFRASEDETFLEFDEPPEDEEPPDEQGWMWFNGEWLLIMQDADEE